MGEERSGQMQGEKSWHLPSLETGEKQRLGEALEEACNAAEGRISLGKTGGVLAEIERALREQAEVLLPARGGGVWHQLRQPRGKGRILE